MDSRSQWLRENYRTDLSEDEKAALLAEYHQPGRFERVEDDTYDGGW